MKSWSHWLLLSIVCIVPACRSTAKSNPDLYSELANPDSGESTWKPITFVDRPELQEGTGAMNVESVPEFSATDSGLKYRILRNSEGEKPTAASTVTVNYRGWLNSGKVFDSSYERGEPTTFPLQNVIAGWTEGMQLVGEGGMIELWVPSRLGYGERGSPGSIPAHSNLHFIVELVTVE
ncbi:Peptidyl-prolyl cis-trans isomerase Mip precursor [Allorhodopirellula heiligendammensis]|mgnify:CR=1 FL=1|uniref:Peptidyl-prolyl cis-trans isomerase n=2 Tax=Allorhodopirellula heiligendammensis TaxID=2714739 RepID=A0A5C6C400_9BACT|nr:Peptidyl-prolyl cis-trans isomerase Mip precursor [Allorhodopirellula heiligendammensis]